MSRLDIEGAVKTYGAVKALDGVSLAVGEGECFGLIGPSGSGKTSLLRAIAGFLMLDAGRIALDGQDIASLPVHRREIGMVFQSYALFPHLNVAENVAFGLEMRRLDRQTVKARVGEALDLVRLGDLHQRRPAQLSGGQQQRVALARALVTGPRLLLLDEPLSALDRRLRQDMQVELHALQRRIGITTIFVTHDQEEAFALADRIAIFDQGRIVQIGAPRALYEAPVNRFAASFLGEANILEGRVLSAAAGMAAIALDLGGEARIATPLARSGDRAFIALRPEKIALTAGALPPRPNRLTGRIRVAAFAGAGFTYRIAIGAGETPPMLQVFVQNRMEDPLPVGAEATLDWEAGAAAWIAP